MGIDVGSYPFSLGQTVRKSQPMMSNDAQPIMPKYCGWKTIQEEDNVIPLRPFCAFPNVNAAFRKSSFDVPPNMNATNLERILAPNLCNMPGSCCIWLAFYWRNVFAHQEIGDAVPHENDEQRRKFIKTTIPLGFNLLMGGFLSGRTPPTPPTSDLRRQGRASHRLRKVTGRNDSPWGHTCQSKSKLIHQP